MVHSVAPSSFCLFCLIVFILICSSSTAAFLVSWFSRDRHHRGLGHHFAINSALESLADELNITGIWLDESSLLDLPTDGLVGTKRTLLRVPLYPLPAVYLPVGSAGSSGAPVNFTLNNVEPRNIQMAFDLQLNRTVDPLFCVVLRTIDTGRVASTGTLLRILDHERHVVEGSIRRIKLTCRVESLVDVVSIDNPSALDMPYRLQHPREYLTALVRMKDDESDGNDDDSTSYLCKEVASNIKYVCDLLVGQGERFGLTAQVVDDLSRSSLNSGTPSNLSSSAFWHAAYQWQVLCNTFEESSRLRFVSRRNEMLVAAAIRKGGPLQLPVQLSSLDKNDRRSIEQLESTSQQEWMGLGMDPTLSFQKLIHESSHAARLLWFSQMVSRARHQLARVPKLTDKSNTRELPGRSSVSSPQYRKGAWFDDDRW